MNPKQSISTEEAKQIFSATDEFKVTEEGDNIKLAYTDENTTSILIDKEHITMQRLVRAIHQLTWNYCNGIFD